MIASRSSSRWVSSARKNRVVKHQQGLRVWDVDGTGLREIEDKTLAGKIRERVNTFNLSSNAAVAALTALYCALPLGN